MDEELDGPHEGSGSFRFPAMKGVIANDAPDDEAKAACEELGRTLAAL